MLIKDLELIEPIKKALKELEAEYRHLKPSIPNNLCYLQGKYRERYLDDMKIAQDYASLNRKTMAEIILGELKNQTLEDFTYFETIHNYIDFEDNIVRKGAVSARAGEKLLIPLNMRDGSILARGLGNDQWNNSAPHGAGRLMSRKEAKEVCSMEDFKNSMKDVFSTSVNISTLDESPMAYKPMEDIVDNIGETVDIIGIIKPLYNFKA